MAEQVGTLAIYNPNPRKQLIAKRFGKPINIDEIIRQVKSQMKAEIIAELKTELLHTHSIPQITEIHADEIKKIQKVKKQYLYYVKDEQQRQELEQYLETNSEYIEF